MLSRGGPGSAAARRRPTNEPTPPTPYPNVNAALADLVAGIHAALGSQVVGVYLSGSLACGGFDPRISDIDLVVATAGDVGDAAFSALRDAHASFAAGPSGWAARTEAVYVPPSALYLCPPDVRPCPQLERGGVLAWLPLESAWPVQLQTLRLHGVALTGPAPAGLIPAVGPAELRRVSLDVAETWQVQARTDPEWLEWLGLRTEQSFVVLTLCRLLYTFATGDVASKPAAARWAQGSLDERWTPVIERALAGRFAAGERSTAEDLAETVALVDHVVERGRGAG